MIAPITMRRWPWRRGPGAAAPGTLLPIVQQALIWQHWKKGSGTHAEGTGQCSRSRASPSSARSSSACARAVLLDRRAQTKSTGTTAP